MSIQPAVPPTGDAWQSFLATLVASGFVGTIGKLMYDRYEAAREEKRKRDEARRIADEKADEERSALEAAREKAAREAEPALAQIYTQNVRLLLTDFRERLKETEHEIETLKARANEEENRADAAAESARAASEVARVAEESRKASEQRHNECEARCAQLLKRVEALEAVAPPAHEKPDSQAGH